MPHQQIASQGYGSHLEVHLHNLLPCLVFIHVDPPIIRSLLHSSHLDVKNRFIVPIGSEWEQMVIAPSYAFSRSFFFSAVFNLLDLETSFFIYYAPPPLFVQFFHFLVVADIWSYSLNLRCCLCYLVRQLLFSYFLFMLHICVNKMPLKNMLFPCSVSFKAKNLLTCNVLQRAELYCPSLLQDV